MNEPQNPNPAATDLGAEAAQIVAPVQFTPSAQENQSSKIKVWHLLVGLVGGAILAVLWFLFTSRSVSIELSPADAVAQSLQVDAALQFKLSGVHLLREGDYPITITAEGFEPLTTTLTVNSERNQRQVIELTSLPGLVTLTTEPVAASVWVDTESTINAVWAERYPELFSMPAQPIGATPLVDHSLAAGTWDLILRAPSYEDQKIRVAVVGRQQQQQVSATLLADWADISIASEPAGAEILIDETSTGLFTPAVVPVPSGEHEIRIKKPGHRSHRQRLYISARQPMELDKVRLERADSLLQITSSPVGAGITVNGAFRGETPLELALKSGTNYRIRAFKTGYDSVQKRLKLDAGEEQQLPLRLPRLMGTVAVAIQPAEAQVYIDGKQRGTGNGSYTLPSRPHKFEVRLDGYAGYSKTLTPKTGVEQELKVKLLTIAEARIAALQPSLTNSAGQTLLLMKPDETLQLGASRREPGRRSNETIRSVTLDRLFYLAKHEVTNAQFQAFTANHDSGEFQDQDLTKPTLPVANVRWIDAAMYCNWLSKKEGLPPFYKIELGKLTGWDMTATGYRLPTEAEWAYSARQAKPNEAPLRFPWGARLPPPDRHGNYADRSASHVVGRIIFGYNDNHIAASPVGTYAANLAGLHDMGGNVAEWVSDFYEIPDGEATKNPIGPATGDYHVIKGSSWMHGTVTDLRLTFRDYGADGRQDLGFRIARYAEAQ